jgi:hypothetical protein
VAWTQPKTWIVGETVTAAMLNTHIRDNLNSINSIPAAHLYKNGNQGLGAAAYTVVGSFLVPYDTDTMTSTTNRITVKTAGTYLIGGQVHLDASSATGPSRVAKLRVNGTTDYVEDGFAISGSYPVATQRIALAPRAYSFAVNDYLELMAYSDGAVNILGGFNATFFFMHRLSI